MTLNALERWSWWKTKEQFGFIFNGGGDFFFLRKTEQREGRQLRKEKLNDID